MQKPNKTLIFASNTSGNAWKSK